jgi:Protein of unknown function (DUF1579)
MRKLFASLVVATLMLLAVGSAQTPPPMPNPGPEHKKLDYFAGDWTLEGDMKPGPFGPGGKVSMTEHNEWLPGGFFLVTHSDGTTPMGKATGLAVFGYNPDEKAYTYQEFNSMGESTSARGIVNGYTWSWNNEEKMGDKIMKGRYTVTQLSPTSYNFKFEMAPERGDFATVMEGKATKK